MFKLIAALLALLAIANAFPAEFVQSEGMNHPPGAVQVPASMQHGEHPQADLSDMVGADGEAAKEGLEKSETFGFGYHSYYPRYYHYGYYPRYYGYYPYYYGHYW